MRQHLTVERPADAVGRRVLVRHRLHGQSHAATDLLGVLEAWSDDELTVRTKDGDARTVAVADVIVVKIIPPQTVTRRHVRDLEAAAALGWQGLEAEWLDGQPSGWLLRAGGGFTGRANSCLPLGDPGRPVDEAVDAVIGWYEERALRPAFYVPEPLGATLTTVLDARGWERHDPTVVMTATLDVVVAAARENLPPVRVDDAPDDAWLAGYHYRGGELPGHAVDILRNAELVGFANVDDEGRRLAIGRGAVTTSPAGRTWLGITAVEVAPDARRRGLGSHVVAGLATWAAKHGATDAYLQVSVDNDAAMATYQRLGFVEHHRYHYRRR